LDLSPLNITGKEAETALEAVGISVSRSTIPNDPNPPLNPSGLRLGTPAVTTRGMQTKEMEIIADIIDKTIKSRQQTDKLIELKRVVSDLCQRFPIPA